MIIHKYAKFLMYVASKGAYNQNSAKYNPYLKPKYINKDVLKLSKSAQQILQISSPNQPKILNSKFPNFCNELWVKWRVGSSLNSIRVGLWLGFHVQPLYILSIFF